MGKRSSRAVAEKRRAVVRTLMARGLEQWEIHQTLSQDKYASPKIMHKGLMVDNPNFVGNPKTGEPVSRATISRDWNNALEHWQDEAVKDVQTHLERQLAEIQELKRAAWAAKNTTDVLKCLTLEVKLLGTARPERKELRWDDQQLEQMDSAKEALRRKIEQMGAFAGAAMADEA